MMKLKYCLISLLLFTALGGASDVQKWVDENGQVHYGEKPPEGAVTEKIDTGGANVIDTSDQRRRMKSMAKEADSRRSYREKREQQKKQQESQRAQRNQQLCERAKQRIGVYRQKAPVFTTKPDGGRDYVEDDERADMIAKLEKDIRRYCR